MNGSENTITAMYYSVVKVCIASSICVEGRKQVVAIYYTFFVSSSDKWTFNRWNSPRVTRSILTG